MPFIGNRRLLTVFKFGIIAFGVYIGIYISSKMVVKRTVLRIHKSDRNQACVQPKLSPFDGDYAKHFHSVEPLKCADDPDWVTVANGSVSISKQATKRHGRIVCDLTYIDRIDDFKNKDMETIQLKGNDVIHLKFDFFKVKCKGDNNKIYENVHAGIHYVPELHKKATKLNSSLGLDVLMLGFDSLSHMTYIRKLKKTYKYFTEVLKGDVLNGYNIVGDGTPQALIPMFTGKTELELPRTLKRMANSEYVDVYPMVWKDFRNQGYVTAWAEDCPHIGTFTYRMKGFKESPADHYMRPFHVTAYDTYHRKHKHLCLGSKKRSEVFMNWVKDFYVMYKKVPKYMFGFHSEASHGDNNLVETADEDLYETLKFLNEGKYLENTLIILMSDHGARFSSLRSTVQGKQEERLPFFGFSFPGWFKIKYKDAFENFKKNINRLTTPFDIYPTFRDILNYSGPGGPVEKERGISLFKEIPASRSCQDASIENHWCACLGWENISVDDPDVIKAAQFLVSKLNSFTEPHRKLCAELKLYKILRAQILLPETNMLKFKKTNDADGFNADLSDNTEVGNYNYLLWIYTSPGNGLFEVTLNYDSVKKVFSTDERFISRVNKYGDAPKCIEKEHEELRKYCYCHN